MDVIFLAAAFLLGLAGYGLGRGKGRGAVGFVMGFLLGPLGLIVIFFFPPRPEYVCPACGQGTRPGQEACAACQARLPEPPEGGAFP